jgi:hypothetical protein
MIRLLNPEHPGCPRDGGDLRVLGKGAYAYVRSYEVKGRTAFVLHAADGTAISVQKDEGAAVLSARNQDLEIVLLH